MKLTIRTAGEQDVPLVLGFIRKLAEYEKLSHAVTATESDIHASLFGPRPVAEAVLAWWGNEPAGLALFFHNFSTFLGKPGLYLEDLFVEPAFRGKGIGKALLAHLAALAVERGCGRFEWSVLDWNTPAIDFYKSLGAEPLNEWTIHRLTGAALESLAASKKRQD
jgi:GNAT superfamily N-acetyltransferase